MNLRKIKQGAMQDGRKAIEYNGKGTAKPRVKTGIQKWLAAAVLAAVLCAGCGAQAPGTEPAEVTEQEAPTDGGMPGTTAPGKESRKNASAAIDYSNARDGYIMAAWTEGADAKLKLLIGIPDGTIYQYDLRADGRYEAFPLSGGNGTYGVGVYRNTEGTEYATVLTAEIEVELADEFAPFIRPNQYVFYTAESAAVRKAETLCAGAEDNLGKVGRVYDYVVGNLSYDQEKAETVESGYLPDIDETLASGKGICFDYAALMAAMLRSQGVPVKLVVGFTGEVYHAWLSVYSETDGWIEGKIFFNGREWKLMDPTFASTGNSSDAILEYIGDGTNYTAKYLY